MDTIEPVKIAVIFISYFIAPELAEIFGSYAVIILASTAGAGWSLGNRGGTLSIYKALWFFTKINLTAIIITVGIASIVANKTEMNNPQWLLAPIAFTIGLVGDEWTTFNTWAVEKIKAVLSAIFKGN